MGVDNVVVFKRSMATGYAGVQNPLFFKDNTQMPFEMLSAVSDIMARPCPPANLSLRPASVFSRRARSMPAR